MYVNGKLKFFCDECKKGFPFKKDCDWHLIHHKKVKLHFCVKPGCGKCFFNAHDLKKHLKIHNKKTWNCPQCQYIPPDERNLKALMGVNSELKPHLCLKCLKLFIYHTQLVNHQSNPKMSCYNSEKYGTAENTKTDSTTWSGSPEF